MGTSVEGECRARPRVKAPERDSERNGWRVLSTGIGQVVLDIGARQELRPLFLHSVAHDCQGS